MGEHNPTRAVTAIQAADPDTYFCLVKVLYCKCYRFGNAKALWGKLSWKKKDKMREDNDTKRECMQL